MSAFKEQLKKDLATFINPDEFASEHTINDIPVTVVVDNDELQQRSDKWAMQLGEVLIFISVDEWAKALPSPPINDLDLLFDGKLFFIRTWNLDDDVYEITLGQNRST